MIFFRSPKTAYLNIVDRIAISLTPLSSTQLGLEVHMRALSQAQTDMVQLGSMPSLASGMPLMEVELHEVNNAVVVKMMARSCTSRPVACELLLAVCIHPSAA